MIFESQINRKTKWIKRGIVALFLIGSGVFGLFLDKADATHTPWFPCAVNLLGDGSSPADVPPYPLADNPSVVGCACNYKFTILEADSPISAGSYTIQCPPNSDYLCSKNNFTPIFSTSVNSQDSAFMDVDTFCLKRSGTSCQEDEECELNARCESGFCKIDIGQKSVEGLVEREVTDVRDTVRRFLNIGLGFLGVVVVIFVIYGGFLWLTAAGSDDKVAKGKHTLIWAAIGALIISIAWTISSYILQVGKRFNMRLTYDF